MKKKAGSGSDPDAIFQTPHCRAPPRARRNRGTDRRLQGRQQDIPGNRIVDLLEDVGHGHLARRL
jgi:hypothetical protein